MSALAKALHSWAEDDVNAFALYELPGGRSLRIASKGWRYRDGELSVEVAGEGLLILDPARLVYAHPSPNDNEFVTPDIFAAN